MRRFLLAVTCSLLVSCAKPEPPPAFAAGDEASIHELLATQSKAWNEGDLESFMAGYEKSDALVFTSGGAIRRGWETTRAKYEARYGSGKDSGMGTLAFEILDVRPLGADGAIVLGKWNLSGTPQAGAGVFSLATLRTATGWKIVHDHTSSTPPDSKDAPG